MSEQLGGALTLTNWTNWTNWTLELDFEMGSRLAPLVRSIRSGASMPVPQSHREAASARQS